MSMTPTSPTFAPAGRRGRGDEGTALVEFAFVFILFFSLLFAIIAFGVLLSFQQTMTQAANEAARAAAVTTNNPITVADERQVAAEDAVERFNSWGRPCLPGALNGTNGMDCSEIKKHDCSGVTDTVGLATSTPDCITVTLVYNYETHPILPNFPLIGNALPKTIRATATAQISDFDPTNVPPPDPDPDPDPCDAVPPPLPPPPPTPDPCALPPPDPCADPDGTGPLPAPDPCPPPCLPPTTAPPVTAPPTTAPEPTVTAPPVTAPPVTAPPITVPPCAPPVTAPPVTAPPVTAPPVTAPPVTAPPVTAPPVN